MTDNQETSQPFSYTSKLTNFLQERPIIYQFLRFGCIGFLNTGLNFLILNTVSKALNITQGWPLGGVAILGFIGAVIQSYPWNRTWTFGGETGVSLVKNIQRLASIGFLGILALVIIFVSSAFSPPYYFYLVLLVIYLIIETMLWRSFGFHMSDWNHESHSFLIFFIVTLIGLAINSSLVSVISLHLHITGTDLDKNIATALATGVSLFWNFTGYKLVVFKK